MNTIVTFFFPKEDIVMAFDELQGLATQWLTMCHCVMYPSIVVAIQVSIVCMVVEV